MRKQASNCITSGKVRDALGQFELALEQQPADIDYLYEYGRILIELDEYDLAVPIGDRAIAAAPDDVRGYALKARALMWSDPGNAIPLAVSGLDIDPAFAPLHAALAIAYTNIGRYDEGLSRGNRAIQLDPLDSFAHRAYSIPLIFTGRNSQAIETLEQAVAINPNLPGPYFELAAQYRAIDVPEMAVGIYRRVLELEPAMPKPTCGSARPSLPWGNSRRAAAIVNRRLRSTVNTPRPGACWARRNTVGATTRRDRVLRKLRRIRLDRSRVLLPARLGALFSCPMRRCLAGVARGAPICCCGSDHRYDQHRAFQHPRELRGIRECNTADAYSHRQPSRRRLSEASRR